MDVDQLTVSPFCVTNSVDIQKGEFDQAYMHLPYTAIPVELRHPVLDNSSCW